MLVGLAVPAVAIGGMYLLKSKVPSARITGAASRLASCGNVTISPYTTQTIYTDISYSYTLTQSAELEFGVLTDGGSNTATVTHNAGEGSGTITVSTPVYFTSQGTYDLQIYVRCPSGASSTDDTHICTDAITVSQQLSATIDNASVSL